MRSIAFLLIAVSLGAGAARAQAPAVSLFVSGGGSSLFTHLDSTGAAKLGSGWHAKSMGIGIALNDRVSVRADVSLSRSQVRAPGATFDGGSMNRMFYGVDMKLRYPTPGGVAPYAVLGVGAVTISQDGAGGLPSFTRVAGRGGLGIEYTPPISHFGVFAEGAALAYKWTRGGFDRTQLEGSYLLGVSYRFGRSPAARADAAGTR